MTPPLFKTSNLLISDDQNLVGKPAADTYFQAGEQLEFLGKHLLSSSTNSPEVAELRVTEVADKQSGVLVPEFPILLAQAAIDQGPGLVADSVAVKILAEVTEAGANAKLVRNGITINLQSGSVILDGDILDIANDTTVKLTYLRAANASLTEKLITSTISENSLVQFQSEKINPSSLLNLKVMAGSVVVDDW